MAPPASTPTSSPIMADERLPYSTTHVLVSKAALALALNALKRDAEEGRIVRAEIAAEIEATIIHLPFPPPSPMRPDADELDQHFPRG